MPFELFLILILPNFQNPGSVPPAVNSRLAPLPPEPAGFNYDRDAPIDIPLDSAIVRPNLLIAVEISSCFL